MKKILSTLITLCLLLGLVACGGPAATPAPAANSPDAGQPETPAPATNKPLVVVSVVKAIGSNWFDSMDWEGKKWAEENNAVHHYIGPTSQDSAAQLQCIEDAIALRPDILTVVPIAADACDALLKQARDQGVLVVTHEGVGLTNIDYNVDAFSNQQFGESFAIKAAELIGEDAKYALVVGALTTPAHMAWAKAFYAYASENYPGMTTLNDEDANGVIPLEGGPNSDTSYSMAKQFIQANPEVEVFWIGSSSCVAGVCRAIEELGLGDKIKVLAVGTASGQKQYYESGTIPYGSFWYPGSAQYACFELGKRILEGQAPQTGDDLIVEGYNSIIVDGINVYGAAWLEVTLDNLEEMCELL
jgi:hypothetical protein